MSLDMDSLLEHLERNKSFADPLKLGWEIPLKRQTYK